MPLLSFLLALFPAAAPSFFLGGQLASSSRGNSPQLMGGFRAGHWDGWLSADLSWDFHQQPFDTLHQANGWGDGAGTLEWAHKFRAGAEWDARDSGVGQTLGVQLLFLHWDSFGFHPLTEQSALDLLWGIRWLGDGLEAGASVGPSFALVHPRDYDFRVSLCPVLNLRFAKIW